MQTTLNCPNCGAAALPDSTRCGYCHSALAALICPRCFGAVFLGMKHCPWCGTPADSARPRSAAALKCPKCAAWLAELHIRGRMLNECLRCGGLWIDENTIDQVCTTAEDQEAVLSQPPHETGAASTGVVSGRTYVPCPVCRKLMNRKNFAGCSGVVIDWCKGHGAWFDKDELRRVVEFIRAGGLKKSREREKDQIRQESRRLREHQLDMARLLRLDTSCGAAWDSDADVLMHALSGILDP